MYDAAILGGGIAGMATAARLQVRGLSTVVFEAHGQPGGCAGFFRRNGFAFDVGATTLVDFEPGGVGGELLRSIGMPPIDGEVLPGYQAWLPDRVVRLYRDHAAWNVERLRVCGASPNHLLFWQWMDTLTAVFWRASRQGIQLPLRGLGDFVRAITNLGLRNVPLVRYLSWTLGDALRHCRLRDELPLTGLLAMLVEDTVHAKIDEAPLINSALGITIRGAGLTRVRGGMYGFWRRFSQHFRHLGGVLRVGCPVERVVRTRGQDGFLVVTRHGSFRARQVISALPISLTARLSPPEVAKRLLSFLERDARSQGGAIVVFLGVPESEIEGQEFTHHQLLQDYQKPLGNGNNMFISVSAPGDIESAPAGCRSVMISTHCNLEDWNGLQNEEYVRCKANNRDRLLKFARRVYPNLGRRPLVQEIGTPRTFERFTRRPLGAVGGVRQTLGNSNARAVPYDIGVPGFWLCGDTTWPGLGTVACVLGSRHVANGVYAFAVKASAGRHEPVETGNRRPPEATQKAPNTEGDYDLASCR